MSKNYIAYVRVSTAEQNPEGQQAAIIRWAESEGINTDLITWHVDKMTGDHTDRPELQKIMNGVGPDDVILVYKLDRLSRSLRDGVNVLSDILDAGARFVSVSQEFDFSGVIGKMVAGLLFSVGELEQAHRRERQAEGIAVAKAKGKYTGGRPKGDRKGDVDWVAKLRSEERLTLDQIAKKTRLSKSTVQRYLREANKQGAA